jgi:hypothetical protein
LVHVPPHEASVQTYRFVYGDEGIEAVAAFVRETSVKMLERRVGKCIVVECGSSLNKNN